MEGEAAKAIECFERMSVNGTHLGNGVVKSPEQQSRLLYQILKSDLPAQEKSKQRIGQEAFSIIAAGGETVARTLTVVTYHLLSNPPMLERLRHEIKTLQPDPRGRLEIQKLEHLPWLVSHFLTSTLVD